MYTVTFDYPRRSGDYTFATQQEAEAFAKLWDAKVV